MTLYAIEAQRFGIAKESVRGTAESAPSKWHPTRGPVDISYFLQHLDDNALRGIQAEFPPVAGAKGGEAKIPLYLDPQMSAEYFYSLLGSVSSAQQGGTAAYKHSITKSGIQPIAYTFFVDRSQAVLKYNLGCVKSIALKGGVNQLVEMDVEGIFKTEAAGSIGSPSFPTQRYVGFNAIDFKIAGTSNTDVKEWSVKIDNTAYGHRTLNLSQDIQDVIAPGKLKIEGGFTIYFTGTTERDKFLANTASAIRILMEGATIASSFKYTVDINLYACHYKAFPYTDENGLLAAKVTFEGKYSSSDSKAILVDITNTDTAL